MSADDDKLGDKPARGPPPSALGPPGSGSKSTSRDGVQHDKRGNAVWQWAVDTGKHAIDSTSRLLKRLDVPGLKLEDDERPGAKSGAGGGAMPGTASSRGPAGPPARTSGYDPYGSKTGTRSPSAAPTARKPATTPRPRKSWWQRLFRRR